jgi:hypothetical protein
MRCFLRTVDVNFRINFSTWKLLLEAFHNITFDVMFRKILYKISEVALRFFFCSVLMCRTTRTIKASAVTPLCINGSCRTADTHVVLYYVNWIIFSCWLITWQCCLLFVLRLNNDIFALDALLLQGFNGTATWLKISTQDSNKCHEYLQKLALNNFVDNTALTLNPS